ncbi:hypothetical protein [uncultured Nostoc sp.]|uniref:hypothetical protein n=1 Tax=uncultured Nostoc sp. TaxID=340711 RepID=UPI0035CAEA64
MTNKPSLGVTTVVTFPPTLSQGQKDRQRFLTIGESDVCDGLRRSMTLKFIKPKAS